MSLKSNSVCKICRRENTKLFLKAERCLTDKCSFERRPYPPGQHGQARLKFSEFALQLREKQKLKRFYGLEEKGFRRLFTFADRMTGNTGEVFLELLELRLDNVVYLMGAGCSRKHARQMVTHGHVTVNGKKVTAPSYILEVGDKVSVSDKAKETVPVQLGVTGAKRREMPAWLEVNHDKIEATVKAAPVRTDVATPVEERLVVEFYSR
jgi:small subunit ribosomal protein S4